MLKDSFDFSERDFSQNKSWLSFAYPEKSLHHQTSLNESRDEFSKTKHLKEDATKTSAPRLQCFLLIYDENKKIPQKYPLNCGLFHVGRGKENHIVISDLRASRRHFVLDVKPKLVELIDSFSENGTKVNGIYTRQRVLKNQDSISIGKTSLIFCIGNELQEIKSESERNIEKTVMGMMPKYLDDFVNKQKKIFEWRRSLGRKLKYFASTVGIVSFFVLITICLVLGGAMVGHFFQEERIEQALSFYKKLETVSHVAAFGDIVQAEQMLVEIKHLSNMDINFQNHFQATKNFIWMMKTLDEVDRAVFLGNKEEANSLLNKVNFSQLANEELICAQKAVERRLQDMQAVLQRGEKQVEKKNVSQKVVAIKHKVISPEEKWNQAIFLYKNGSKQASCTMIKELVFHNKVHGHLVEKAQAFLLRKCTSFRRRS